MSDEPSAYSFTCENEECLAIMCVYPHPESPGLCDPFVRTADMDEAMWEDESPNCPNCGEQMNLEAGDPVSHRIVGTKGLYR